MYFRKPLQKRLAPQFYIMVTLKETGIKIMNKKSNLATAFGVLALTIPLISCRVPQAEQNVTAPIPIEPAPAVQEEKLQTTPAQPRQNRLKTLGEILTEPGWKIIEGQTSIEYRFNEQLHDPIEYLVPARTEYVEDGRFEYFYNHGQVRVIYAIRGDDFIESSERFYYEPTAAAGEFIVHSTQEVYDRQNNLRSTCYLKNGELNDPTEDLPARIVYNAHGQPIRAQSYKDGEFISDLPLEQVEKLPHARSRYMVNQTHPQYGAAPELG